MDARGLFGGAAKRVVLPGARTLSIDAQLGERGVLLRRKRYTEQGVLEREERFLEDGSRI